MLRPEPAADVAPLPRCAVCAEPIGVFEPLVYEDACARPVDSAVLRLPAALRRAPGDATFFHAACRPATR